MTVMRCIVIITLLVHGSKCSHVMAHIRGHKGLHVSDYCPEIGECSKGSHVMCLYNPARIMGPACYDYVENVTITPEYAEIILSITNRIRSKIANGQVKAQNVHNLPRGYGMFKVVWDEELATFAQVWANQCILRGDSCRSSKKFPEVGQALGITRLSLTNWMPIHKHNFSSTTLTPDKVKYSLISIIKAWWDKKDDITPENVKNAIKPGSQMIHNKFLNLIHGPLTHMGCGISVYREYAYKDNNAEQNFNCIQLVCNFSTRPKYGELVYTIEAPSKPGYTVRCGCPVGYEEDESCLCYLSGKKLPYSCQDKNQCKPSAVVLPIITADVAPTRDNNTTSLRLTTNEMFGHLDNLNNRVPSNIYNSTFSGLEGEDYMSDLAKGFPTDVKNRLLDITSTSNAPVHNAANIPYHVAGLTQARGHAPKPSLFSKFAIFKLPIKKMRHESVNHAYRNEKEFKKDVAPRKDFTKIQKLVSLYLDRKRNGKSYDRKFESNGYASNGVITYNNYNKTNAHQSVKGNKKNFSKYANKKIIYDYFNTTKEQFKKYNIVPQNTVDSKLMSLLDKLEQEVKNMDLNSNEKRVFDEKIRKIYGTIVGKSYLTEQRYTLLSKDSANKTFDPESNFSEINQMYFDTYGLDNRPKHNRRNFDNSYNSVANNDNKLDRYSKRLITSGAKNILSREDNENFVERRFRNMHDFRNNDKNGYENQYTRTGSDEYYSLSRERKKYYHEKLTKLQKKINNMKRINHPKQVPEDRQMRPVRPTQQEKQLRHRRLNDQVNSYYMPERARFLHGF